MKRQTQKTGVRTYFGDDLVDLQTQPLNAIDAMLAAAGQCVISGCEMTPQGDKFDIAPGYVALEATDQATGAVRIMAMPFAGVSGVTLPIYLTASVDVVERAYGDGAVKPIAYAYSAIASAIKPAATPSIEITAGYTRGLSDALAESLAKYIAVTATEKAVWNGKETPAGAQAKADAAKTAAVATAKTYTDGAVTGKANANHSHGVATAAADGFMAKGDKSKLDGVATGANNYAHPADANTRHVTDAEKATWNGKSNGDHTHAVATTGANGLMAAADKVKLNGVATSANNYTHPADANTRHVTDAEKAAWNGKVNATANNGMTARRQNSSSSSDEIQVIPDGINIVRCRDNSYQLVCQIASNRMTVSSDFSMPGVLRAGRVLAGGGVSGKSWGAKSCVCRRLSGGKYEITHNIDHADYYVNVTPVSNGSWTKVHGAILEKTTTYVVIGMYDSGYENFTTDYAFEFMICGRN